MAHEPTAFPSIPNSALDQGMSLRDWFAGQVLPAVVKKYAEDNAGIVTDHLLRNCPVIAYRIADAMLEERRRERDD